MKTFILIQAEPQSDVAAVVAGVAAIPGVDWAEPVRGPFDVIAQATTDVDLVSVTAVSGVLHALASPTIEPVNAAQGEHHSRRDRVSAPRLGGGAAVSTLVRSLILSFFCAFVLLAFGAPALAQEDDGKDHVVITGGLVVPAGETVTTAVVFNGPVSIEGTVSESLVVFNGRTEISGNVNKDVVVFNGRVTVRSGAEVGGDLFSRSDAVVEDGATVGGEVGAVPTKFDFEDTWFPGRIAWWIGYTVSTLVLGLILFLFAPRLDDAIAGAFRNRRGASIGFGIALFFLIPIVAVLLLVTIVGIPLGLFVLLALALLYTVGYVAGAHALGRMLVKRSKSALPAFLAGLGILRLIAFVPILGGVTWLVASVVGLGILAVAARSRSSTAMAYEPAAPPPPPPITQT